MAARRVALIRNIKVGKATHFRVVVAGVFRTSERGLRPGKVLTT